MIELAIAFYYFGTESIINPKTWGSNEPPKNKISQNNIAVIQNDAFPELSLLKKGIGSAVNIANRPTNA